MNNKDMPAMPVTVNKTDPEWAAGIDGGLTKREMFAMHYHAALLMATNSEGDWTGVRASAEIVALEEADKMLALLDKEG